MFKVQCPAGLGCVEGSPFSFFLVVVQVSFCAFLLQLPHTLLAQSLAQAGGQKCQEDVWLQRLSGLAGVSQNSHLENYLALWVKLKISMSGQFSNLSRRV